MAPGLRTIWRISYRENDMSELDRMIRTYAFTHDCDLDHAAWHVLRKLVRELETSAKEPEGLYDRIFGGKR